MGVTGVPRSQIVAAGAVVWRLGRAGQIEVCLVHRPARADWTIPKGKLDRGESVMACAVREVAEETGHRITLGRRLSDVTYAVNGRPKVVHYWSALADDAVAPREPDREVDKVEFVPVGEALRRLDYDHDRELVEDIAAQPIDTSPLVVVRHAKAVARAIWKGADRDRPLDNDGRAQAKALVPVLNAFGVTHCLTSTAVRCVETLRPWAESKLASIRLEPALSEDGFDASRAASAVDELAGAAVVCTHRPVLPSLLRHVGAETSEAALDAGEFVVAHRHRGAVVATERHSVD